jgi:hypothetical protein
VVEFGEWLCLDVLKKIPHRHFVFSIPKILRRYFLYFSYRSRIRAERDLQHGISPSSRPLADRE